jgi:hypothetical protein
MAINLLGASDAKVSYGDMAAIAGLTALTVSITFNASSIANDERICSQWSSNPQAWLIANVDTDEIFFLVAQDAGGTVRKGVKTTDTNFATGTLYRCVFRWRASDQAMQIWVNGVSKTTTAFADAGGGAPSSINNSTAAVTVGKDSPGDVDGWDADYSEFALHSAYMPDDYCIAYGKGYSPKFYRRNGILYAPFINTNTLRDQWGGLTGTNTAGTAAAHPRVIYPTHPWIGHNATGAAPGGFQAAWARGANTVIGAGARMA